MLKQIEAAASRPVTLEQLKGHCRVDFDDDNDQLEIFLDAATEFVAMRTGLTPAPSSWEIERCDWWSGCLQVLLAPVRDVVITYRDANGDAQTVAEDLYRWERAELGFAEIRFLPAFTWPAVLADAPDAVQIAIDAGFDDPAATGSGDDPELALPKRLQQAILMVAAYWYENREAAVGGDEIKKIPLAAEALIFQLRIYR